MAASLFVPAVLLAFFLSIYYDFMDSFFFFLFFVCVGEEKLLVYESYPSVAQYLLFISINESFDFVFSVFFITLICPGFKFHLGFSLPRKKKNALSKA